ncbi:MAG: phosphatase PAP2 family protein [Methanobrevibacter sp.]|nr:phosphatase PAP2 family protein [Methanobrevibacter sp.]
MLMPVITGAGGFICLCLFLILLILFAKFKKMETLKKIAILALVALLFSDLIAAVLKNLIQEPRPFVTLNNVHLLISENDPCSFPSGHTTSTVAVVTFFVLNMKDLVKKHYLAADVLLIVFAIIIPFSRMYVGVHYPGDVVAGAIIGLFGALVINNYKTRILSIIELSKQKLLGKMG